MKSRQKSKWKKTPSTPLFIMSNIFTEYYRQMRNVETGHRAVAWVTLGFPKQLLFAMNIQPVYPQFHAAFQSSRGKASAILRDIEDKFNIPHDICGEVKAMLGTVLNGDQLAFKLPNPDFMIASNSACGAQVKGMSFLHQHLNLPFFFCDYPTVPDVKAPPHTRRYVQEQQKELVQVLEKKYHTEIDWGKYQRIINNDYQGFLVWREIMKLFRTEPTPMDAMDLYFFSLPFFIMDTSDGRFLDLLIKLYNELFKICKKQVTPEAGGKKKEIRLLWDALPVYHKGEFFKSIFEEFNGVVVVSSYFSGRVAYPVDFTPLFDYPLTREQVLTAFNGVDAGTIEEEINYSLENDANRPIRYRKGTLRKMIRDFNIDAVIMHMDRTCRPVSLPQYELMRYVWDDLKTPVILFDADTMDERYFSKNQILTRVEAFMERLQPTLD